MQRRLTQLGLCGAGVAFGLVNTWTQEAWAQEAPPAQAPAATETPSDPADPAAPTAPAADAPGETPPAQAPPPAPAKPTQHSSGPIVEQVQVEDHAPHDDPLPSSLEEPPVPPPPEPRKPQERASFAFGLGFGTSVGDIQEAFPWGFNVQLLGSLRLAEPLHANLGLQLGVLRLKNAGSTGYIVCDGYSCSEESESGLLVSLPLGLALHAPVGEHRLIFGAGGLYSWYSADTYLPTGVRSGPGAYGRVTWSIPGSRGIYYDLFVDGSLIFGSGERFQGRLPSSSSDFWLNFGFAIRFAF